MPDDTLLILDSIGVPLYSARGLTQKLEPIQAAKILRRSVNGTLYDLSYSQFQKYRTEISCTDQAPPAFDSVWPGRVVTVSCVAELSYLTASGSPGRSAVDGSSHEVGGFTLYRPVLQMRVTEFEVGAVEWAADVPWRLSAEEI